MSAVRDGLRYPGAVDGIDVSMVQGRIDFEAVRRAGFLFAVAKASEGLAYCDPRLLEYLEGFRAVGMIVSIYGFARPSQERARDQARRFLDCAGEYFAPRPALDLESAPDDWSAERIVAFGEEYADELASQSQLHPIVYTYPSFAAHRMQPALASSARLGACPLWLAQYRSTTTPWVPTPGEWPKAPQPWSVPAIWQYSGNGGFRVPGVPWDCDRNLFRGDYAALREFFGLPPEPDTIPEIVRPALTGSVTDDLVTQYQRERDRG